MYVDPDNVPIVLTHPTTLSLNSKPETSNPKSLSLLLKSIGEATHVVGKITLVAQELNIGAINLDTALLALSNVLLATEGSEAPVLGDDDLLAARELVLRATQSLESGSAVWHMVSTSVTLYRPQLDTH